MAGRRGNGGPEWGNIDWSNFDLRQLGGRTNARTPRPPGRRSIAITVVLVLILLVPLIFGPLVGFLTDLFWFRSLGLEDVYLRRYTAGFWPSWLFSASSSFSRCRTSTSPSARRSHVWSSMSSARDHPR